MGEVFFRIVDTNDHMPRRGTVDHTAQIPGRVMLLASQGNVFRPMALPEQSQYQSGEEMRRLLGAPPTGYPVAALGVGYYLLANPKHLPPPRIGVRYFLWGTIVTFKLPDGGVEDRVYYLESIKGVWGMGHRVLQKDKWGPHDLALLVGFESPLRPVVVEAPPMLTDHSPRG